MQDLMSLVLLHPELNYIYNTYTSAVLATFIKIKGIGENRGEKKTSRNCIFWRKMC